MLESSNIKRVVRDDGTLCLTTAYGITVPAHKCMTLAAIKATGALVCPMGVPGDVGGGKRTRGFRTAFFGQDANNKTITGVRIYALHKAGSDATGTSDGAYNVHLLMTIGASALGNIAGAANMPIRADEFGVDTIGAITESEYYTALKTLLVSASPAIVPATPDDTLASLFVPDAGGAAFIAYDFDLGTATGAGVLQENMT